MKAKYLLVPLAIMMLGTGLVWAQQTPPSPPPPPVEDVFALLNEGSGYLGVYAEDINRENMSRYGLSQVRGVAVTQVVKDSPAEKAGLRKDDVILRIDGENVTSVRKLNRVVSEIAPDQSVRVAISRAGSEQEITATMGRRKSATSFQSLMGNNPKVWKFEGPLSEFKDWKWQGEGDEFDGQKFFSLIAGRRIGVSTVELTKQLADYFGITNGKGVLVTSVTEDGPAAKAGLKAGDVITAVDGEEINTTGDISRIINRNKEGDVTLTVIRNRAQQTIRVTPSQSATPKIMGRPQVGRQIVIPKIVFPTITDVNISMPSIEIQTIPSINIQMPTIRVIPRVRMVKGRSQPI